MGILGLFRRPPFERTGFDLYTAAVAAARDPALYGADGAPDTIDGRFDLVSLHVSLLIHRLRRDSDPRGGPLAQAVFDAMFADMDKTLRELGVGDLSVGRKVRAMWEGFHGRAQSYETALEGGDRAALAAALARNVWRGEAPVGAAEQLAGLAFARSAHLAVRPFEAFAAGDAGFPAVTA